MVALSSRRAGCWGRSGFARVGAKCCVALLKFRRELRCQTCRRFLVKSSPDSLNHSPMKRERCSHSRPRAIFRELARSVDSVLPRGSTELASLKKPASREWSLERRTRLANRAWPFGALPRYRPARSAERVPQGTLEPGANVCNGDEVRGWGIETNQRVRLLSLDGHSGLGRKARLWAASAYVITLRRAKIAMHQLGPSSAHVRGEGSVFVVKFRSVRVRLGEKKLHTGW